MTTLPVDRPARRGLPLAVVLCAAASAVALYASSRIWGEDVVQRPAPLAPTVERHTGTSLAPWLPAVALVSLAGAGALVATRGAVRVIVGLMLVVSGAGVVAGAIVAVGEHCGLLWPVVTGLAGIGVTVVGILAVRRGRGWPAMGTRYERPGPAPDRPQAAPRSQAELWDALDRGEDPTAR
jgi:Tryptophan-associated transmembrane protein (Trp_oprn_chp)